MLGRLLLIIWALSLAPANASPVRVVLSQNKPGQPPFKLTVQARGHALWSDGSDSGFALVAPRRQLVVYSAYREQGPLALVARSYEGQPLWEAHLQGALEPLQVWAAGGDLLLMQPFGPAAGVQVDNLRNWSDIFRDTRLIAFDLAAHRVLWESNTRDIGFPIWTNGTVFLAARLDLSPRTIHRVLQSRAKLPVWLEERRVKDTKVLRRWRLRGYPPGLTKATTERGGRLGLWLADRANVPYGYGAFPEFLGYLKPLHISIPVFGGAVASAGEEAVLYRRRYKPEPQRGRGEAGEVVSHPPRPRVNARP